MWDGPDGMGFDSVGDAMRSVTMQYDATPCHATLSDWMEFYGMGWDSMLCAAMPWDWIGWDGDGGGDGSSSGDVNGDAVMGCDAMP